VDANGVVYVADELNNLVQVFSLNVVLDLPERLYLPLLRR